VPVGIRLGLLDQLFLQMADDFEEGTGPGDGLVDPLVFAVPVSLLFSIVVSFFSKKPSAAHLAACFPAGR